jgi:hypothetical protein
MQRVEHFSENSHCLAPAVVGLGLYAVVVIRTGVEAGGVLTITETFLVSPHPAPADAMLARWTACNAKPRGGKNQKKKKKGIAPVLRPNSKGDVLPSTMCSSSGGKTEST